MGISETKGQGWKATIPNQ